MTRHSSRDSQLLSVCKADSASNKDVERNEGRTPVFSFKMLHLVAGPDSVVRWWRNKFSHVVARTPTTIIERTAIHVTDRAIRVFILLSQSERPILSCFKTCMMMGKCWHQYTILRKLVPSEHNLNVTWYKFEHVSLAARGTLYLLVQAFL
jgi:hypothetical protein